MRIRLALTLDITRDREPQDSPERPPAVDAKGSFLLERADPAPVGFTADPGRLEAP